MPEFIRDTGVIGLIQLGLLPIVVLLFLIVLALCKRLGKKVSFVILIIGTSLPWIPTAVHYYIGYKLMLDYSMEAIDTAAAAEFPFVR